MLISVGVATRLFTSTTAPLLKAMPLGLIKTICPFAVSRPAITEGSPGATRFRVTEVAVGCWKFVCSLGGMLKLANRSRHGRSIGRRRGASGSSG